MRYEKKHKKLWDEFLNKAINSHFIFHRDFMEYHKDRFDDFSLMFFDDKKNLVAILPAHKNKNILYSHLGLSFGGIVVNHKIKLTFLKEILEAFKDFLKKENIKKFVFKKLPFIYHKKSFYDDVFLLEVNLIRKDLASILDLKKDIRYSNGRKHSIRKAKSYGFLIEKTKDFKSFWMILEDILKTFHSSRPVHTLEEIEYLSNLFPRNIELFLVKKEKKIFSGAVCFVQERVVKLQYVANTIEGRKLGALDFLIDYLIKEKYKEKDFIDFGTSLDSDKKTNFMLVDQKERFGCGSILYETYEMDIL